MTELFINNSWIEVEDVKLKRQISSFGELESRTNITNKFKINWTKENAQIFQWFLTIQSNSLLPYIETPVKLRRNKNMLIENGIAVVGTSDSDSFPLIVRDGNIDFFTEIKGKSLIDLDLSDLDFTWDLDYANDNRTATDKPVFLLFSFGLGKLDIGHMLPFIPLNLLVTKILTEAGFTGSGDLLSLSDYTDLWISLADSIPTDELLNILSKAENVVSENWSNEDLLGVRFSTLSNTKYLKLVGGIFFGTQTDAIGYEVLYIGNYTFTVHLTIIVVGSAETSVLYIQHGTPGSSSVTDRTEIELSEGFNSINQTFSDVALSQGDYIYCYIFPNTMDVIWYDTSADRSYLEINEAPNVNSGVYGQEYTISNNLPIIPQNEIIEIVLKLFNARVIVTGTTVKFITYAELQAKIKQGEFTDWSDKHFTNVKVKYKSDYAQKNYIKYNNSDIQQGFFPISDPQLKKEKTVLKLPFVFAENLNMFKSTTDDADNVSYEFTHTGRTTMKKRSLDSGSETIFAAGSADEPIPMIDNIPNTEDINLQEYMNTYYGFMEKTLNMYREIKADVYLNINDFNKIDFEKPIWIKNWGWFLLEPLIFREGLTTVTLIHINKSSFVPDIAGEGDYDSLDYNSTDYLVSTLVFVAEYQTIYDSFTIKPSAAIAAEQNTLVLALVNSGIWAKFDTFYMFAQTVNSDGEALKNWINPGTFDATLVNAPAFVALEGFTGDGATSYINTNYIPSDDGINLLLNDVSFGLYSHIEDNANRIDMGSAQGVNSLKIQVRSGGDTRIWINDFTLSATSSSSSLGMFIASRSISTTKDLYINKSKTSFSVNSLGLTINPIFVCCRNLNGSPNSFSFKQFSLAFTGASLSQSDVNTLTDAFEVYMDSNGKGVIS